MCAQVHPWVSANLFLLFSHCAKRSFLFHTTAMASIPVHIITKRKREQGDRERERNQNVTSKPLSKNKELVVRVCMETDDLSRCIRLRRFESNEPMQLSSLALTGRKLSTHVPANTSISF